MRLFPGVPLLAALLTAATVLAPASPAGAEERAQERATPHCARQDRLHVPGAEHQQSACLADLTTAGLMRQPVHRHGGPGRARRPGDP